MPSLRSLGREAAAYVQGPGLKAVAAVSWRLMNSRPPVRKGWWFGFTAQPGEKAMTYEERQAALDQLTALTITLERLICEIDRVYDALART